MRHRLRETLGLLVALLVAVPVGAQSAREVLAQVRAYRQQHAGEILQELAAWLRLPNVATNVDDIKRNAELLRGMMEKRGIRTEILPTDGGRPVVYGELEAPGAATTLLLYCHYDGQPVDATRWRTPPFEPTLRERAGNEWKTIPFPAPGEAIEDEWRLFARSVSDDKSPIVAVLAALDALRAGGREPRVNLKFLLEGEEEAGSPFLRAFVRREKQRLGADVLII
ncbi:MAG: M20/M25/M40 family metallo-hydrolase, partial [Terriglobia bacterium]